MATFYNQAFLNFNGVTIPSNVTAGEIVDALAMDKTALTGTYTVGDTVSYIISLTNSSATERAVTLTDDLGAYPIGAGTATPLTYIADSLVYFINGEVQPTPAVTAGPPLSVTGITVPAGGNVIIAYSARVNGFANPADGGTIVNTATVIGGGEELTASETVTVASGASLDITKSLSPASVEPGGTVTYTFVIRNSGNAPILGTDNVTVTDTFDPALSGITVSFNGTPWTEGTEYTYNAATGVFATLAGALTVPAATYTQDPVTGAWTASPGVSVITVTGTL